jgi:GNAT superfamily N-acetyltransferase
VLQVDWRRRKASISFHTHSKEMMIEEYAQVHGENHEKFSTLNKIFQEVLVPLYGPQENALSLIKAAKDRICFLQFVNDSAVGVLVFKTTTSDEYADLGIKNSIEIKSLFLYDPAKNSGLGYASNLLKKLFRELEMRQIAYSGIHVTVSADVPDSLAFFLKKGFFEVHRWKGRYIPDVDEILLYYQPLSVVSP